MDFKKSLLQITELIYEINTLKIADLRLEYSNVVGVPVATIFEFKMVDGQIIDAKLIFSLRDGRPILERDRDPEYIIDVLSAALQEGGVADVQ